MSTSVTRHADSPSGTVVEQHHIEIIPAEDRQGRPRDQFTLWFATNANVVNFVLGGLAISAGLNLLWALVAIVAGNVLGMLLTALHAWQGPRLGVPQMIQSRGQFGFYGASFIMLASIVLDIGYLAASQVLQGDSLNLLVSSVSVPWWILIVTLPSVALAIFGYRWIHVTQRVLTAVLGVVIVVALIQAAAYGSVQHADTGLRLSSAPILIAVTGLFFMNMLSWAPYVSDYSRYLPADVSFGRTFAGIFGGAVLSTTLFAALGAWITAMVPIASDNPLGAVARVSGLWILFFMALSQVPGDAINAYTGMMAVAGLGSNVRKMMERRSRQAVRLAGILVIFVIGTVLAMVGYSSFLTSFENFIDVLLFFFVPWSAINLVDYYLIKRGRYDVRSFFTPSGAYGRIQWWPCVCYVVTLAAQVPFMDQAFYTGPFVKDLDGADISWIVGFAVAAGLYAAGAWRGRVRRSLPALAGEIPDPADG
ncbi:MAG TPA: cytosine permease [Trebonia sp.]|jgi:NCS1 family nucleobase:cation symporter-1|nr:cytosine permease [Trebonia sp.]